jgi:hypothetical protein
MTMIDVATAKATALHKGHVAVERRGFLRIGESVGIVIVDGFVSRFDFDRLMKIADASQILHSR